MVVVFDVGSFWPFEHLIERTIIAVDGDVLEGHITPNKDDASAKPNGSSMFIFMLGTLAGLCCTNRVRDSSRETSVVIGMHEQTHTPDLQDHELAGL